MVDQNGREIVVTLVVPFHCGHEAELPIDNNLRNTKCPVCADYDERAEKEEVVRRMEMGLGIQ